jgi:N-acetylmuramoyl-L-alanine amidase
MRIIPHPLPYVDILPGRPASDVDLVVIHCTELPDLATAREYGERVMHPSGAGNSGHFYVDRDGRVEAYVPGTRVAHHTRGYNPRSIGIELVNTGRYPDWFRSDNQVMTEPYPAVQVEALLGLLAVLRRDYPALAWLAGHEDLDTGVVQASDDPARQVPRKRDPGPCFPWARVLQASGLARLAL